jgi:hypothetical protein
MLSKRFGCVNPIETFDRDKLVFIGADEFYEKFKEQFEDFDDRLDWNGYAAKFKEKCDDFNDLEDGKLYEVWEDTKAGVFYVTPTKNFS